MLGCAQQIVFAGKLARLRIVDHQNIHVLQRFAQLRIRTLDPVVHGIQRGDLGALFDLMEHVPLQLRRDVGEENEPGVAVFLRQARFEFREYVQFGRQRYAFVQVLRITSGPEKCFPGGTLQPINIDGSAVKNPRIHFREVVTHDPYQIYVRKETSRHGEIGSRAAKRAFHLSIGAFQGVECDGTYNE